MGLSRYYADRQETFMAGTQRDILPLCHPPTTTHGGRIPRRREGGDTCPRKKIPLVRIDWKYTLN